MFYIYSILLPALILFIIYFIAGRPRIWSKIVNCLFTSFIVLIVYTLVIYFLEMESYIDSGWAFYSLLFFLTLFRFFSSFPFKMYFFFQKGKNQFKLLIKDISKAS